MAALTRKQALFAEAYHRLTLELMPHADALREAARLAGYLERNDAKFAERGFKLWRQKRVRDAVEALGSKVLEIRTAIPQTPGEPATIEELLPFLRSVVQLDSPSLFRGLMGAGLIPDLPQHLLDSLGGTSCELELAVGRAGETPIGKVKLKTPSIRDRVAAAQLYVTVLGVQREMEPAGEGSVVVLPEREIARRSGGT